MRLVLPAVRFEKLLPLIHVADEAPQVTSAYPTVLV